MPKEISLYLRTPTLHEEVTDYDTYEDSCGTSSLPSFLQPGDRILYVNSTEC